MVFVEIDDAESNLTLGYWPCGLMSGTSSRPKATGEPSWSENSSAILKYVIFRSHEASAYLPPGFLRHDPVLPRKFCETTSQLNHTTQTSKMNETKRLVLMHTLVDSEDGHDSNSSV